MSGHGKQSDAAARLVRAGHAFGKAFWSESVYGTPNQNTFARFVLASAGAMVSAFVITPILYLYVLSPEVLMNFIRSSPVSRQIAILLFVFFGGTTFAFSAIIGLIVSYSTRDGVSSFLLFQRGLKTSFAIFMITGSLVLIFNKTYSYKIKTVDQTKAVRVSYESE